jgi:hypothetical protein
MPCSMVSSDDVVLGPVTAVQSGSNVRGRLARSGGIWWHTGRPPARCLWVRSFSGGPRSEPDWHLSAHPALQRLSRAVCGWLPPAGCTQDFPSPFRCSALRIPPGIRSSFTAWPPSPCGRLSRPPWRGVTPATTTGPLSPWDSRPAGDPAFVPVIRASATQAPRSSPWMPSLGIAPALEVRPHPTPCGRSAGHRFHASFRRGQGFTPAGDQGSGNPALAISRGSPQRAARTHRHGRWFPGMLLSPSPFRSR